MPFSFAAAEAIAAKDSGVRSFGGVFTRSRATLTSAATTAARSTAALCSLSRGLAPSRATSASGAFGAAPLASLRALFSPPW